MKLKELQQPAASTTGVLSAEDEARILEVIAMGESAWSKPMSLEEFIQKNSMMDNQNATPDSNL